MTGERLRDGHRVAELLASELVGGATPDALSVTDADPDVEPTEAGALAYRVRVGADADGAGSDDDATLVAEAYVHPERVRLVFHVAPEAVAAAAETAGLRVRPAGSPPDVFVFVEDGAQVKRVLPAFAAAVEAIEAAGAATDGR